MSNGLSQDEINALLSGAADSDSGDGDVSLPGDNAAAVADEDLDGLISQLNAEAAAAAPAEPPDYSGVLSAMEIDTLGEVGNISMGTAATTLFSLLNHKVEITTPRVSVTTLGDMARQYPMPFVSVEVQYSSGLEGVNCLFLHENDVKIITDLMMGGDGKNTDEELNEMHLSCIGECMNQMVGASSTSLSQMFGIPIDISPPVATLIQLNNKLQYPFDEADKPVVRIGFNMVVEGLIDSEIMQVMPIDFGKSMVEKMLGEAEPAAPPPAPAPAPEPAVPQAAPAAAPAPQPQPQPMDHFSPPPNYTSPFPQTPPEAMMQPQPQPQYPPQGYPQQPPPGYGYPPPGYPPQYPGYPPQGPAQHPVDVRPATFANFGDPSVSGVGENMDLLLDVPLAVSVEIGKSKKYIKDILDFNTGTIVVLDKMAGELVDVVVNGKLIARGEVVIIDDYYGCRITEIVNPSKRISV